MARPRKPWYRKSRDTWYVEIDGVQTPLAKGKENRPAAESRNRPPRSATSARATSVPEYRGTRSRFGLALGSPGVAHRKR